MSEELTPRYVVPSWGFIFVFLLLSGVAIIKSLNGDLPITIITGLSILLVGLPAGYTISQIWWYIFNKKGGYDNFGYSEDDRLPYDEMRKYIIQKYRNKISRKVINELENPDKTPTQSVYGFFLHNYGKGEFITWLHKRWTTFHTNYTLIVTMWGGYFASVAFLLLPLNKWGLATWYLIALVLAGLLLLCYSWLLHKNAKHAFIELRNAEKIWILSIVDEGFKNVVDELRRRIP